MYVCVCVCVRVFRYFSVYDSGDRQPLLDAYHDGASFSLSMPFSAQNPARYTRARTHTHTHTPPHTHTHTHRDTHTHRHRHRHTPTHTHTHRHTSPSVFRH